VSGSERAMNWLLGIAGALLIAAALVQLLAGFMGVYI